MIDIEEIRRLARPKGMPFRIGKIGHVVVNVRDVARSVRFYTEVLGFEVSDIYPHEMVPGGMAFLRCNPDHHGIALVGSLSAASDNVELNHIAFEVGSLDEVLRARATGSRSISKGAAAPAASLPSSSAIPTTTGSKFIGASTRSAARAGPGRATNGTGCAVSRRQSPIRCPARTPRCTTPRCSRLDLAAGLQEIEDLGQ